MTDSNFQIIAVDNDSRELDKIRKAFDLLKTPCLPILYNEGDNIDEKYSNIRIAFFDINLGGLGNPADPLLCNIIASALKEILDKNNGPYALIFWSLHISKLPIIKKSDYPFMHLLYSQLLVCQRVCLQNTVCLICK